MMNTYCFGILTASPDELLSCSSMLHCIVCHMPVAQIGSVTQSQPAHVAISLPSLPAGNMLFFLYAILSFKRVTTDCLTKDTNQLRVAMDIISIGCDIISMDFDFSQAAMTSVVVNCMIQNSCRHFQWDQYGKSIAETGYFLLFCECLSQVKEPIGRAHGCPTSSTPVVRRLPSLAGRAFNSIGRTVQEDFELSYFCKNDKSTIQFFSWQMGYKRSKKPPTGCSLVLMFPDDAQLLHWLGCLESQFWEQRLHPVEDLKWSLTFLQACSHHESIRVVRI